MVKVVSDIGRIAVWVRPRPGVPDAGRAAVLSHCAFNLRRSCSNAQEERRPLGWDGWQVVCWRWRRRRSLRCGHWPVHNRLSRKASGAASLCFVLAVQLRPALHPS